MPLKLWLHWIVISKPIRSFVRKVAGFILGMAIFKLVADVGVSVLSAYHYPLYISEPAQSVPLTATLIRGADWSIGMILGGFTLGLIGGNRTLNYSGGFPMAPIIFTDYMMFNKGISTSLWSLILLLYFASAFLGIWLGEKVSAKLFQQIA